LGNGGVPGRRGGSDDDVRQCRTFTDGALAIGDAGTGACASSNAGTNAHTCSDADAHTHANANADADADSATFAIRRRSAAGDDLAEPSAMEQHTDSELLAG
jgi:hypothetical protein